MAGISSPFPLASRLLRVQTGQESIAWGVAALATSRLMAVQPYPQFKPIIKATNFDEDRGSLVNAFLSSQLQQGGTYTMNFHATYEDILYRQMAAVQAVAPTGVGPYTWSSVGPTTSAWQANSYTMEWGYDIGTLLLKGCLVDKYTIKGEASKQWEESITGFYQTVVYNDAVNISSTTNTTPITVTTATNHGYQTGYQVIIAGVVGNAPANGTWIITVTGPTTFTLNGSVGTGASAATGTVIRTLTPSIADRVVEVINTPGTQVWIDPAGTAPGTTLFNNTFVSFQLDIATGLTPIWTGDQLYPTSFVYEKYIPTLQLSFLYGRNLKSVIDTNLIGGNGVVVQIKQTSGTKSCTLQFAGTLADDPTYFTDNKGAVVVDVKLEGRYDVGALANQFAMTTINGVAALP